MRPLPAELRRALADEGQGLTLLVIRLGAMGDILRTVPPARLLRRALPRARILWVLEDKWRAVLEGHPDLNGILEAPRRVWDRTSRSPLLWPELVRSVVGLRRELRRHSPTLALDFHGNLRSGLVCRLSGAPVRLGYDGHQQKEGNRRLTTHRVPAGDRRTPRMERNLDLVRALGIPVAPLPSGALPLVERGRDAAAEIAGEIAPGGYAIVSPGASASQAYKKPPPELLAAACRVTEQRGFTPLVVYGPGELDDARRAVEASGGNATLAPPTDLATLAALLAGARLFIGGDSGPLHLACATGCPVLGIYGPTDPEVNRPWGVPHRAVCAPDREYTGIKRLDRPGGFVGLDANHVTHTTAELLDRPPRDEARN
ncbi:MAG: glycosyltransferase family 9 protein [bacterium]|nr:glycosyltransferase family 9 protein [bacterium]